MQEQESTMRLLLAVVAVNLLVVFVVVYGVSPDLIPGPVDDVAVAAGAYQLASRTGMIQQVMALMMAMIGGSDNDTEGSD